MRTSKLFQTFILAALAMTGIGALSQANVAANQTAVIYVSNASSSGLNAEATGASSAPLGSIQAAVNLADLNSQKGIGSRIVVAPGVYREAVTINGASSSAPLSIESSVTGAAVIAASDVLTGWSGVSGHPNTYYHSWTYNFGNCPTPTGWPGTFPAIARRTEMVFVNNVMYTQVLSESQLRTGTFYVDESANQLLVSLPSGLSANSAKIEAAVRSSTLSVNNRSNTTISGMTLEHARTCINRGGANINGGSHVTVDHVQAIWNGWGGLQFNNNSYLTVQNSIASHNGGVGFTANNGDNVTFSNNESDFNNWRGAQGALYDWGMGGTKFFQMQNVTVQHHYSYGNQAQGLWFDTENKHITINDATVSGSAEAALQLEANPGPILVEYGHFCGSLAGVNFLNSENVTLKSNLFYNNGSFGAYTPAGIFLAGRKGGHVIGGQRLYTAHTVMTGNTIVSATSGQHVFGTYLTGGDWSQFADSLNASGNRWYNAANSNAFQVSNGRTTNFSGWKSAVGTDYSSSWGSASTGGCSIPSQSFSDFQINLNSQTTYSMSSRKVVILAKVASFGYGSVNLSASGVPSGVSVSMSQSSVTNGIVSITLTASGSAANRTVPITFFAVSGSRVHTVTANVHVVP
jgi:hypothetical protein